MLHRLGIGAAMAIAIAALAVGIVALVGGGESPPKSAPEVSKADRAGYTKAFVDRAIDRYEAEGRADTVAYYNTPASIDGEWYVFIIDENDRMIAHAARPERLGTDSTVRVDVNGYDYGSVFQETTEDGQWISYYFQSPGTGAATQKHSWVVRHDGLLFGSGWYER